MNETERSRHSQAKEDHEEIAHERNALQQTVLINTILEATFSGIYSLQAIRDPNQNIVDFKYLFANSIIADLLQVKTDQLVGRLMLEVIPENKSNGFFDLFCQVLATGQTAQDQVHFVTSQMNAWFNFVIKPVDRNILVVTLQDITDLKNAVLELEQQKNLVDNILKNSSNGISVTRMIRDTEGNVTDASTILANDAAVNFTGLSKEIYLGKTATELDPNILQSGYGQTCLRTLATGVPSTFQYYLEVTGRWLELSISKLDDNHLIHIFTDVTAIKKAEQKMTAYVEELKLSNATLQQFTYAASHDLKEPIRKIETFADRLIVSMNEKLSDQERTYFQRMQTATTRMRSLIDDLLTYSNVATLPGTSDPVDLNEVLKTVVEDLEIEIEEKHAHLVIGKLPTVKGDRRQLQQLFQNIISNALKYHRPQIDPRVIISCRRVEANEDLPFRGGEYDDRNYYLIQIEDNGIGFEPAHAENIFGIFTRLHNNDYYKGSGVGLAIARKVADNHEATLWAEGRPDAGATFNILLPADEIN